MSTQTVVHYFDTAVHHIACGIPGFDRSTKHVRAVTCPACVEHLREDAAGRAGAAHAEGAAAH
jgi:hypothetical protein